MENDSGTVGARSKGGAHLFFYGFFTLAASGILLYAGYPLHAVILGVVLTAYNFISFLQTDADLKARSKRLSRKYMLFSLTMLAVFFTVVHHFEKPRYPATTVSPDLRQMKLNVHGVEPGFSSAQVMEKLGKPTSEYWHTTLRPDFEIPYMQSGPVLDTFLGPGFKRRSKDSLPDQNAVNALKAEWEKLHFHESGRDNYVSADADLLKFASQARDGHLHGTGGPILIKVLDEPLSDWLLFNKVDYTPQFDSCFLLSPTLEHNLVGVAGHPRRQRVWEYEGDHTLVFFAEKDAEHVESVVGPSLSIADNIWLKSGDPVFRLKTLIGKDYREDFVWDIESTAFAYKLDVKEDHGTVQHIRLRQVPKRKRKR